MKKTLLMIGLLCLALPGLAQDTLSIDLDRAIAIALDDNPTIRIAQLEIERVNYVKREAWGNLLPDISTTASYSNALKKTTMDFGGQKISLEPSNTVLFAGTVTLPLFAPGAYQNIALSREQMRAALEAARGSRIEMVAAVKKGFYDVLRVQQELAVLLASQANVQKTVDDLRVKFDNGLSSEYDLLTAQVQLSNLEPSILQAQQGLDIARMYLKMLLGLPLEQSIALEGDLHSLEQQLPAMEAMPASLENNSDLRALDIQADLLTRQFKALRTQRMPTLGAQYNAQIMGRNVISFGDASAAQRFEWQRPMTLGASLSVPLFAGFTNLSRERQIKMNIRQVEAQRDYAEQQMQVQLRGAIGNIATARERLRSTAGTVEQAGKAYQIAAVRFDKGAGTILELNSAELQLTQSQLNHSQAVYDLLAARAEYEKIVGTEYK